MVTVAMWAVNPLFVRHFASYYNVWTQNAFRYLCATAILLVFVAATGQVRYRLTRAQWHKLMLVAAVNLIMQTCYAATYTYIYPAAGSLVTRINVVFTIALSFAFFHDERGVIRSPRFLAGAALALLGVVAVIVGRDPALLAKLYADEERFWIGVAFAIGLAFWGSVYSLAIKHAVRDIPPMIAFTHVSWMTAIGLCALMFSQGGVADLWRQPMAPLGLMALTALLSIVIAHVCYYAALRDLKAVITVSMMQLTPVFTCILSAIVYRDTLSPLQIAGGVLVISGAWLAALAQAKAKT